MIKSGFFFFIGIKRPRWLNTFSCAFSRTEHVFNRMTSASSGFSVGSMPSVACSRSAMRDESYSFIWQPKVLIKTFFGEFMAGLVIGAALVVDAVRAKGRSRVGEDAKYLK